MLIWINQKPLGEVKPGTVVRLNDRFYLKIKPQPFNLIGLTSGFCYIWDDNLIVEVCETKLETT